MTTYYTITIDGPIKISHGIVPLTKYIPIIIHDTKIGPIRNIIFEKKHPKLFKEIEDSISQLKYFCKPKETLNYPIKLHLTTPLRGEIKNITPNSKHKHINQ